LIKQRQRNRWEDLENSRIPSADSVSSTKKNHRFKLSQNGNQVAYLLRNLLFKKLGKRNFQNARKIGGRYSTERRKDLLYFKMK